jgi:broad specificity phosphatase PhoE
VPTRVYLLRHAETATPLVFHGAESDVELSERGRRQTELAAPLLAALRPDGVVSSAMRRARDTAVPIAAACGVELRIEAELHERRVGCLSGTPVQEDGVWPETLRRWIAGETAYAPTGAESFADIRARVMPVWDRLTREFEDRSLLIIAHGVVCRVLILSLVDGLSVADWHKLGPMRNMAVNELVKEGNLWKPARLNEVIISE